MKLSRMKFLALLAFGASLSATLGQTNAVFQDCHVGDQVRVSCERPVLALNKALLLEIGSNTVTVCTAEDRFILAQTNVVLVPWAPPAGRAIETDQPASPSLSEIGSNAPAQSARALPISDYAKTLESIRASIIDPNKEEAYKEPKLVDGKWVLTPDPNSADGPKKYEQANEYYRKTMAGLMDGSISQDDLVRQARDILRQCDQYQPERVADPHYEDQIAIVRDFVHRSESGEKINFAPETP